MLHVIMACHNRRELTLRAVDSALASASRAGVDVDFTVYDDGSKDGTSAALSKVDASISILIGDGSAFWARSMAAAEKEVLARSDVNDWIVWLNDDVLLDETAIEVFMKVADPLGESIYVGAMSDPDTGVLTYGGLVKSGWHPLRFDSVAPADSTVRIDSFNGNLVFVPVRTARKVGGIDGSYSHALADIDYGLRCGQLRVPIYLLPGMSGYCPRNIPDQDQRIWQDWKRFVDTKGGGNFRSLARILGKNAPRTWMLFVSATYSLWWYRRLLRILQGSKLT